MKIQFQAKMSLTKLSLGWNNLYWPRESLVRDTLAALSKNFRDKNSATGAYTV